MKTILLATLISAICAAQVTAEGPADWRSGRPLFWVTSTGTPSGAALPVFDFHWNAGAKDGELSHLQSYVVVVHFYRGKVDNDRADEAHWLAFSLPAVAHGLSQADTNGRSFGPGAGSEPASHYLFEFYALDTTLELQDEISFENLRRIVTPHTIGHTTWLDHPAVLQ